MPIDYCDPLCGPGTVDDDTGLIVPSGKFQTTLGRCECNNNKKLLGICNKDCQKNAPSVQVQRDAENGTLHLIMNDASGTKTMPVFGEYGLGDFDYVKRPIEFVDFREDGAFGLVPKDTNEVEGLFPDALTPTSSPKRRRRRAVTVSDSKLDGIRSPLICVTIGKAVLFKVVRNDTNRNHSHYPVYSKNHIYNTNTNFDFGQFRQLDILMTTTDLVITTFVNVFAEEGTYVFHDKADPGRETIVKVPTQGGTCLERMDASGDPTVLSNNAVGKNLVSLITCC